MEKKRIRLYATLLLFGAFIVLMSAQMASANAIDDVKHGVAGAMGLTDDNAGIFLGISVLGALGVALTAGCRMNALTSAIILFVVTAFLCLINLLPVWITIIFFIIMGAIFARFMAGVLTGAETGGGGE